MKSISTTFKNAALLIVLLLASAMVKAELSASVDRDRVAMGDTIRLTITATNDEPINNLDPRPLLRDFEILQRSSSSSTRIVNGEMTSTRALNLDITPLREGSLRVPPLSVGRDETNYLLIAVGPATTAAGDPLIDFVAELDQDSVYVQGQSILTLRIQQAVNLESRSITDLVLENAFVKPLEQKSFQRTIDGRPWLVHEIRYAIFPEKSGVLEIPQQTFSARESNGRRSMFDMGSSGRKIQRKTKAIKLQVLPQPDSFPASNWLPARNVQIEEHWSTPPEQLRVGESATRRITIKGEGLQGAQLPPVLFPSTSGLKYYPDQPVVSESEVASGLLGSRADSAALVPTQAGTWTIPEIRIPWWDTSAQKLRYATVPARSINVAPALDSAAPGPVTRPTGITEFDSSPIAVTTQHQAESSSTWKWVALLSAVGWALTLLYLLIGNTSKTKPERDSAEDVSERSAYKALAAACASDNGPAARTYLIQWAGAVFPKNNVHSLDAVESHFRDSALTREIELLNDALYSCEKKPWTGTMLIERVKELRSVHTASAKPETQELRLYPS